MATDEMIDIIASIEMRRQEVERKSGGAAACGEALRTLQELLECESEALRRRGAGSQHSANIAAVTTEIDKVKRMIGGASPRIAQRDVLRRGAPQAHSRHWGHRAMGRNGGR